MSGYRDGYDLIMGAVVTENNQETFKPLGYSSGCKISDSTETGERATKEPGKGKFKEKYVKSLAEQITAEGFVYDEVAAEMLRDMCVAVARSRLYPSSRHRLATCRLTSPRT